MPIYSMENTETGDVFEITLSMAEREVYLENNPHIKQVFNKFPGVVDSVRIGIKKPDRGFDEVLSKAKNAHKYSTVKLNH